MLKRNINNYNVSTYNYLSIEIDRKIRFVLYKYIEKLEESFIYILEKINNIELVKKYWTISNLMRKILNKKPVGDFGRQIKNNKEAKKEWAKIKENIKYIDALRNYCDGKTKLYCENFELKSENKTIAKVRNIVGHYINISLTKENIKIINSFFNLLSLQMQNFIKIELIINLLKLFKNESREYLFLFEEIKDMFNLNLNYSTKLMEK